MTCLRENCRCNCSSERSRYNRTGTASADNGGQSTSATASSGSAKPSGAKASNSRKTGELSASTSSTSVSSSKGDSAVAAQPTAALKSASAGVSKMETNTKLSSVSLPSPKPSDTPKKSASTENGASSKGNPTKPVNNEKSVPPTVPAKEPVKNMPKTNNRTGAGARNSPVHKSAQVNQEDIPDESQAETEKELAREEMTQESPRCSYCVAKGKGDAQIKEDHYYQMDCDQDCEMTMHKQCLTDAMASQGLKKKKEFKVAKCITDGCSGKLGNIEEVAVQLGGKLERTLFLRCEGARDETQGEKPADKVKKTQKKVAEKKEKVPAREYRDHSISEGSLPVQEGSPPPSLSLQVPVDITKAEPPSKPLALELVMDAVPLVRHDELAAKYAPSENATPQAKKKKKDRKREEKGVVQLEVKVQGSRREMFNNWQEEDAGEDETPHFDLEDDHYPTLNFTVEEVADRLSHSFRTFLRNIEDTTKDVTELKEFLESEDPVLHAYVHKMFNTNDDFLRQVLTQNGVFKVSKRAGVIVVCQGAERTNNVLFDNAPPGIPYAARVGPPIEEDDLEKVLKLSLETEKKDRELRRKREEDRRKAQEDEDRRLREEKKLEGLRIVEERKKLHEKKLAEEREVEEQRLAMEKKRAEERQALKQFEDARRAREADFAQKSAPTSLAVGAERARKLEERGKKSQSESPMTRSPSPLQVPLRDAVHYVSSEEEDTNTTLRPYKTQPCYISSDDEDSSDSSSDEPGVSHKNSSNASKVSSILAEPRSNVTRIVASSTPRSTTPESAKSNEDEELERVQQELLSTFNTELQKLTILSTEKQVNTSQATLQPRANALDRIEHLNGNNEMNNVRKRAVTLQLRQKLETRLGQARQNIAHINMIIQSAEDNLEVTVAGEVLREEYTKLERYCTENLKKTEIDCEVLNGMPQPRSFNEIPPLREFASAFVNGSQSVHESRSQVKKPPALSTSLGNTFTSQTKQVRSTGTQASKTKPGNPWKTEEKPLSDRRVDPAERECQICCDPLDRKGVVDCQFCHEPYHRRCIVRWIEEKAVCPNCNRSFPHPDNFPSLS